MKKRTSKLFRGLMALLLVVSVFLPALKVSTVVQAEELPASSYTMKTVSKINNNKLVDGAKYGEGKFYLQPTYSFPNDVTLKDGDYMVYALLCPVNYVYVDCFYYIVNRRATG